MPIGRPALLPLLFACSAAFAAKDGLEKFSPGGKSAPFDTTVLEPLEAYTQVRSAGFWGWADTGMYIGTIMGRYPQAHHVASPGADRRQATFFSRRIATFHFNPVPARRNFLYTFDAAGDEQFQLRLFDLRRGESRPMGMPPGRVDGLIWNDSGTAFAYAHVPAGSDRWDIRLGRSDGKDSLVLSLPGTWSPMDIRPDGKRMLVQRYVSASEAELYALDIPGGSLTLLTPGGGPSYVDDAAWIRTPAWAAGGAAGAKPADSSWSVVFTSDRGGEAHRLYLMRSDSARADTGSADFGGPLRHAAGEPIAVSVAAQWDVEWVTVADDRRTVAYAVNEDGFSRLWVLEAGRKDPRALVNAPAGVMLEGHFRPGPKPHELAVTVSSAASPGDVYMCDLTADRCSRWTYSETGGLPADAFRTPQLVRYRTQGQIPGPGFEKVPAWVYRPDSAAFPGLRPVLIQIHGGPELQSRPGFDPYLQFLAGRMGYAVILPNVRGSSGYGKSWLKADDGYQRMGSVKDIGALLDWIKTQPGLDAGRVAVAGRSYGGFMSLACLTEYGPRLKAGVSGVGISHFPTFLKKTSGYRRDQRRAEYGDERDPRMAAFLDSISPLTRADRIRTPLLLSHGRNDPRVPYGESERIFAALKAHRVPAWFLTFGDEGHGVRDVDNQLALWKVETEFLAQQLGTPAAAARPAPAGPKP